MIDFPQLKGFRGSPGLVRLIGHRGARGLMPENTIEGFNFTLDMGVKALEFDVLLSKDNVPIITHDTNLSEASTRNSKGKWLRKSGPNISELTLTELKQFDVGGLDQNSSYGKCFPEQKFLSGVRIPTLSELLDLACLPENQNLYLLLEIKSEPALSKANVVSQIVREIRKKKIGTRTVLHSFDWDLLKECLKEAPEIPRSFLSELPENSKDSVNGNSENISPDFYSFNISIPKTIANLNGQIWCPNFKDLTYDLVREAHDLGLLVCTWTVNEIEDIENSIDIGVDGIVTDYPNRAQKILKSRGMSG